MYFFKLLSVKFLNDIQVVVRAQLFFDLGLDGPLRILTMNRTRMSHKAIPEAPLSLRFHVDRYVELDLLEVQILHRLVFMRPGRHIRFGF